MDDAELLPEPFTSWFASRGWSPWPHQQAMIRAGQAGDHALLIAPTGAGKTLAGFLPSLLAMANGASDGLHTVYVSPLKALAVDIARNLEMPVREMGLSIRIETRTGDTPLARKQRQRASPPQILLTTPESLSLLLSYPDAAQLLAGVRCVVIDEIHAFATTKRGDLLALALARLSKLAPQMRRVGLSATIADETAYARWLAPDRAPVQLIHGNPGAAPLVEILVPDGRIPWSGHAGVHAMQAVYGLIARHRITIVFVNTRSIAERLFQQLWALNTDNLPIGLHHGSLAVEQRRKVEAAMAAGKLRAVVATASLDLGLDWGDADLVIQMGAPKGSARLLQRIGRANHRLEEPSRAVLVPGNRFEYLEAQAALDAVVEGTLDGEPFRPGSLDSLAQHLLGLGCAAPFDAEEVYAEVRTAEAYRALSRRDFDDALSFAVNGGYALRAYDQYRRLTCRADGLYQVVVPRVAQRHRMNAGVIVEQPMLTVRLGNFRNLGKIEEWFASQLSPGDSFLFGGQKLEFEGIRGTDMIVRPSRAPGPPRIPTYGGARMPLSTHLADRVRAFLADPGQWTRFPSQVQEWLELQQTLAGLPPKDGVLVETFPHHGHHFLVAYCFEGRNAHQTLGLLLTRRMEARGLGPLGFVCTDYVLAIWSLLPVANPAPLFAPDILEAEFNAWMAESSLMKRSFRDVAMIAGLIERQPLGPRKNGRQLTISSDLIYDVLKRYEPDHLLMRATWSDAKGKITDLERLDAFLQRINHDGHIRHQPLDRVSPLAVPALLEIGKEQVSGSADDLLLAEADALIREATGK
jgi:ATP-dependent helicase Lhr and Lhr-like helicase